MQYLELPELMRLYNRVCAESGGLCGVRDHGLLDSSLAQPRMTFGGQELYPTLADKAAALGFSLIKNHPFLDGNKRIGHAAIEVFLLKNGMEINCPVDQQERIILDVASGLMQREPFTEWLRAHVVEYKLP